MKHLKAIASTLIFLVLLVINPCLADDRDELWSYDESVVSCSPKALGKKDILTINLGKDHGKELAVLRESDNRWYFLVVTQPPEEMVSLMTPSQFKKVEAVKLNTKSTGLPWEAFATNEVIFDQPGKYTVVVSEILESEVGGYKCSIEYLPSH